MSYAAVCEKACGSREGSGVNIRATLARPLAPGEPHLDGHALPELIRHGAVAGLPLGEELVIVLGVREDDDAVVVLCRGAEKGDAANVDLLDGLGDRGGRDAGDRLVERVQVAHDDGDGRDLVGLEVGGVRGDVAGEDACAKEVVRGFELVRRGGGKERRGEERRRDGPPWTAGWRVLTRPPSISGYLVMSETSLWKKGCG